MNIGFVATRLAGVDGVSLETAKLAKVFADMGHQSFYCAGELDADAPPSRLVPAMHFADSMAKAIHDEVFFSPGWRAATVAQIYDIADTLRAEIDAFVDEFDIDLIVPQNASTIPMNISLGVAIADLIKRRQIKAICHHHDFYWERERFISNDIQDILDEAFPPRLKSVQHLVISRVMQRRLYAWRGIQANYLPNVFDFENPPPPPDAYAMTFRQEIGLSDDDLIVLQPTRIIRRKAIQKAIELVRKLNDDRLVFIVTGYEGDEPGDYGAWLREEADRAGIRYQFIGDRVAAERGEKNGKKTFSLWDIYPHAHFVTYPSVYEGFGNAFVETMYFRKPVVVHTYPAYMADIKSCGVHAVEFYHDLTEETLANTRKIIDNAQLRDTMTEHNYSVGMKHFSYQVLRRTLAKTLGYWNDD